MSATNKQLAKEATPPPMKGNVNVRPIDFKVRNRLEFETPGYLLCVFSYALVIVTFI